MKNLKEILIDAGDIEKYFDGKVPVNLWRAKNLSSKEPIFSMVEQKIVRNNGKVRPSDITIFKKNGTDVPSGLAIVEDGYNIALGAKHYTIAPAFDMPLSQFKQLLNSLAQNLIKEIA